MRRLSLRPYNGALYVTYSREDYEKAHKKLFRTPDVLSCAQAGRFSGGEGRDGVWIYLIWAESPAVLAHELAHVVFHVFSRAGIDPRCGNEEPFCYLLSQLMMDVTNG